jgi:hypothetical protein
MTITEVTEVILPSEFFEEVQSSNRLCRNWWRKLCTKFRLSPRVAEVLKTDEGSNRKGKGSEEDQGGRPEGWFEDGQENYGEGDEFPVEQEGGDECQPGWAFPRQGHGGIGQTCDSHDRAAVIGVPDVSGAVVHRNGS